MEKQDNLSLLELALRIVNNCLAHWVLFVIVVTVPTIAMFISVMWVLEPEYEIEAVVTPPPGKSSGLGGGLGKLLDNADLGGLSLGGGDEGENIAWTYLNSWELHQKVIDKFGYVSIYEFDKKDRFFRADIYKKFRKNLVIEENDEEMIEVRFRDKDPERAAQVLEFILFEADSMYNAYKTSQARASRAHMDVRMDEVLFKMDSLQKEFTKFQKDNKYYDPKIQVEMSLRYLSTMQSEKDAIVLEQAYEEAKKGKDTKRYEELTERMKALDATIAQVVSGKQNKTGVVGLEKAPNLSAQFAKLENEIKIQMAVYKVLRQQSEQLLLEEVNMQKNLVILQPPWANDKKVYPRRGAMLLFTGFISGLLAMALCCMIEYLKSQRKEPALAAELSRFTSFFKKS